MLLLPTLLFFMLLTPAAPSALGGPPPHLGADSLHLGATASSHRPLLPKLTFSMLLSAMHSGAPMTNRTVDTDNMDMEWGAWSPALNPRTVIDGDGTPVWGEWNPPICSSSHMFRNRLGSVWVVQTDLTNGRNRRGKIAVSESRQCREEDVLGQLQGVGEEQQLVMDRCPIPGSACNPLTSDWFSISNCCHVVDNNGGARCHSYKCSMFKWSWVCDEGSNMCATGGQQAKKAAMVPMLG